MIKLFSILWAINLLLLLCAFVYLRSGIEELRKKSHMAVTVKKSREVKLVHFISIDKVVEKLLGYFGLEVYYTPSQQVWTKEKLEIKKK